MNRITWVITGAVLPYSAAEFFIQEQNNTYINLLIWISTLAWSVFASYKRAEDMLGKSREYRSRRIFQASGPLMLEGIFIVREIQNTLREEGINGGWLTPIGIALVLGVIVTYGMLALVPPIETLESEKPSEGESKA